MRLRKFIKFETKRVLGWRYLAFVLVFYMVSFYFFQNGISQYKHIIKEKYNFQEFEKNKSKFLVYTAQHGLYGVRIFFLPSPLMTFFNSGVVPEYMIAFLDSSERMKIYQPLIGESAFSRITSLFMTFAGFILLFGSPLCLLYGFTGSKDHEWLKLLEDSTGRRKLFFSILISKTLILMLFCLIIGGLSMILFVINGVSMNPFNILIICFADFVLLLFFMLGGLIAGTLKNRFLGWASMIIACFVLTFVIPVLIYHWTYGRAGSIKSPYKAETVKLKLFQGYERSSFEEGGKFDKSKYGEEKEVKMFLVFWNGDFKKIMKEEKDILYEMKDRISFCQTFSAIFPTSFFLSVNHEMSSRGFSNLVGFNEYTQEKKKEYIWFIADHIILNNKKVFEPFFKGNENIYQGKSQLPGNFNFGMAVSLVWLVVLLGLYWHTFNRMLDHVPKDTKPEFKANRIKKNIINVVITSDRGPYPKLLVELSSQNTAYVAVPKPVHLPGESKVKDLLALFGLAVPDKLQKKAGKYIYSLEADDNARVLLEIIRSLANKPVIIIFDNFLTDLSDDCINEFAELLKSKSFKKTVVYFTKSILTSTKIADYVHRCPNERPVY